MTEGFSVRQICTFNGLSQSTVQRIIHYWLDRPPKPTETLSAHNLIFDGTFLFRRCSLIAIMDAASGKIIHGQYGIHENSLPQLQTCFFHLRNKGLMPVSCTVDGNPQVMRALKTVWPNIIIQRCLVHIQRQGLMWCRKNPSRLDAKKLRKLFLQVVKIHTIPQRNNFLDSVNLWEKQYGSKIANSPERGWVFSDLKRARSMLLNALHHMFHYLHNPAIPNTTNSLEGYFARLKNHYRQHRGLSPLYRSNYFTWYFHLRPK